jgi:crotonobetainyl-CoA:carnitine CoA-transferase CaiB-like acyl-CoA transferase
VSRPAPLAGEHTAEVLRELGVDPERYERLAGSGVVASDDGAVPDPVPAVR